MCIIRSIPSQKITADLPRICTEYYGLLARISSVRNSTAEPSVLIRSGECPLLVPNLAPITQPNRYRSLLNIDHILSDQFRSQPNIVTPSLVSADHCRTSSPTSLVSADHGRTSSPTSLVSADRSRTSSLLHWSVQITAKLLYTLNDASLPIAADILN